MKEISEFVDKVVLVTGAGRGVGRAVAQAFAARGAIVAANDLTPINLDETLERVQASGGRARDYVFDIAKKMPIQALVQAVLDDWGRIDVLVNSASVRPRAAIQNMDEWDWQRTFDVNLGGPFFTMQTVGRVMVQQGEGVMVNIALAPDCAQALREQAAYLASQSALVELTRQAAGEFDPHHIRVNTVCPGLREALTHSETPHPGEQSSAPGWYARLHQVAEATLFLCSQAAAHITGQVLHAHANWNDESQAVT